MKEIPFVYGKIAEEDWLLRSILQAVRGLAILEPDGTINITTPCRVLYNSVLNSAIKLAKLRKQLVYYDKDLDILRFH